MYIKQLSIKNYRNFGDPAFELSLKPFTLILGENNIGKTNLLNALCLLFGQEISISQSRVLQLDDLNYEAVTRFRKQVADLSVSHDQVVFPEVEVTALLANMNEDQEAVVGDWFSDAALTEALVTYRFSLRASFNREKWITQQRDVLKSIPTKPTPALLDVEGDSIQPSLLAEQASQTPAIWKRVEFPIGDYRYLIYGGGKPTNECDSHFLRMLKVELLDALRDAQRELIASGEYRLLYRILRQGHDSKYADLKDRLLELEDCVRNNAALNGIKNEVTTLLQRVSLQTEDADNSIDFNFSSPDAAELLKKIGMIYGANPINVNRNGLGRNNLLYISLVLSQIAKPLNPAETSLSETTTFFRVVGIEEPEAHLHPHLQDHLARNIEAIRSEHSDAIQLLLTSHSTHIAAKLDLENTVVLFAEPETGRLSSHYILSGIDITKEQDAVRFLSLYLDATKSRMFFARRLILVEGIAEQTLVPRFFELHKGESLERHGATVLNVHGVAFRHFLTIIKNGFFRKCVVLTDQDTGTATENRATNLKSEFDDGKVIQIEITTTSTFEKEVISANVSGKGKGIILDALKATRPQIGQEIAAKAGKGSVDVDACFDAIADYKAEFAFNLAKRLDKDSTGFILPNYIQNAFSFLV